ncbi:MAG TPA: sialidase family protein [Verrucomicrobiae bacterium]|nr:sialidase family protein [Verrucomicrobiae bacterium]
MAETDKLALAASGPLRASAAPLFETTCVFPVAQKNSPNYRIPALLRAPNNDLLAFAEKRNDGPGDIGNHDIVYKRSRDRGRTWGPEQIVFDDGDRTCTDITVGADRATGKLWLFFLRDKKQFACFTSTNDGAKWQGPLSIHEQVTLPEWDKLGPGKAGAEASPSSGGRGAAWAKGWSQRYGVGPGNAIVQLRSGRLVVPARHREDIGGGRLRSFSHVFYSDDHGATWKLGGSVAPNTSECQLVELADGGLMLIARDESAEDAPANLRHRVAISRDGGSTWGPVRRAEELITPRCHGAVERFSLAATQGKNRLLFSNPASPFRETLHPYGRTNLTVRVSYDEGATWTPGKTIWPCPSSYSDIAVLDDMTVGLVYERGPAGSTHYWDEIQFARFDLNWLTDEKDTLRPRTLPPSAHRPTPTSSPSAKFGVGHREADHRGGPPRAQPTHEPSQSPPPRAEA